jgi:hypothetical protein
MKKLVKNTTFIFLASLITLSATTSCESDLVEPQQTTPKGVKIPPGAKKDDNN